VRFLSRNKELIPTTELPLVRRVVLAVDLVKQGFTIEAAAGRMNVGVATVRTARVMSEKNPEIFEGMRNGDYPSMQAAARAAGRRTGRVPLDDAIIDTVGRAQPAIRYGKGDKFDETIEPLRRYLSGWQKRGYEFRHVNFREAARRVAVLSEIDEMLAEVKKDLASRVEKAKLHV
jgi:hypothetical protein